MSDLFSGITESLKSTATAITRNEYIRKVAESVNDTIMNYPKPMMDVREATNEDPWGPTGPQMKKIAEYTRSRYMEDFYNVFTPLFARMLENNKDAWRRVYKSLVLLDYLLKNGSERFVSEAREKTYEIRRLESYKYIDEKGKDQGINIRHRAKLVLELLNDDDKLQTERQKANSDDKSKYRGYDQHDMRVNASYNKSSSYDNNKWGQSGGGSSKSSGFGDYTPDRREVSNFSFSSSSNNRSPSPELGFADDSKKKVDDDDGFGDFVSSRSHNSAKNKSIPNAPRPAAQSFFDNVPAIPPPSANAATAGYVAPPLSPVGKKEPSNFDLLGGFDAPAATPVVQNTANDDIFAQLSAPVLSSAPPAATTVAPASGIDLFDFGAPVAPVAPVAQVATMAQAAPVAPSNGAFNGFDFGSASIAPTPAFGNAAPLKPISGAQQPQASKQVDLGAAAPKIGNSFAGLDDFMGLSLGSSSSSAPKAKTLNQMMGGNM